MKKGTITFITGLVMIACSIMLSVWVMSGGISLAEIKTSDPIDGIIYDYDEDNLTAKVKNGSGATGSISLNTIEIGGKTYTVTAVGDGAFKDNGNITSVKLNDVDTLGNNAFMNCPSLEDVNLGDVTAAGLGSDVFLDCSSLKTFTLSGDSANSFTFKNTAVSVKNISTTEAGLYSKDGKELYVVPGSYGDIYIDTDTVSDIKSGAFSNKLETVYGYSTDEGSYAENLVKSKGIKFVRIIADEDTYTLHFEANGGSGTMADENRTVGANLAIPENQFTKTNYTFTNWNTKQDGSGTSYADKASTSFEAADGDTVTLYAQWTPNGGGTTITVTFDPTGGTVSYSTKQVTVGSAYGAMPTPVKAGYDFTGWYTDPTAGTPVSNTTTVTNASNHTLYARWTSGSTLYSVTYDWGTSISGKSGEYATTRNLTKGAKLTKPTDPSYTGYTFKGWFRNTDGSQPWDFANDTVQDNMILYAYFTRDSSSGGGSGGGGSIGTSPTISVSPSSKTIYVDDDASTISATTKNMQTGDKVVWSSDDESIVRISNERDDRVTITPRKKGSARIKAEIRRDGTTLASDYCDVTVKENSENITVSFMYNDGRRNVYVTQKIAYGGKLSRPADPSPYTVASNGINFATGAFVSDTNMGALKAENTVSDVAAYTAPVRTAATTYTFTGWYKESSCVTLYDFNSPVYNSFTLYAGWTPAGTTTINNGTAVPGGTATGDGSATGTDGSNTGSTGKTHTKDDTPTTGIEDIDPRYFLCMAILLTGIATIIYSRHQKSKLVFVQRSARDNGDLD